MERRYTFGEIASILKQSQFQAIPELELPSICAEEVLAVTAPFTAQEAFNTIMPIAARRDAGVKLYCIYSSETGVDETGRCQGWEFRYVMPQLESIAYYTLNREYDFDGNETTSARWHERVDPIISYNEAQQVLQHEGVIQQSAIEKFKVDTLAQPALPVPFIDSPTVALELARAGVDFINNLDEIIFTGKVLPSGEAVWEVMYDDKIYYTRFA